MDICSFCSFSPSLSIFLFLFPCAGSLCAAEGVAEQLTCLSSVRLFSLLQTSFFCRIIQLLSVKPLTLIFLKLLPQCLVSFCIFDLPEYLLCGLSVSYWCFCASSFSTFISHPLTSACPLQPSFAFFLFCGK